MVGGKDPQKGTDGQAARCSLTFSESSSSISDCTKYDLYSVIHHVGVMVRT